MNFWRPLCVRENSSVSGLSVINGSHHPSGNMIGEPSGVPRLYYEKQDWSPICCHVLEGLNSSGFSWTSHQQEVPLAELQSTDPISVTCSLPSSVLLWPLLHRLQSLFFRSVWPDKIAFFWESPFLNNFSQSSYKFPSESLSQKNNYAHNEVGVFTEEHRRLSWWFPTARLLSMCLAKDTSMNHWVLQTLTVSKILC